MKALSPRHTKSVRRGRWLEEVPDHPVQWQQFLLLDLLLCAVSDLDTVEVLHQGRGVAPP